MKTPHEKASYIASGGKTVIGSVRYKHVYERAKQEIGELMEENQLLKEDNQRLIACVLEFREYAISGKSFNYPLGSLQRIDFALEGNQHENP